MDEVSLTSKVWGSSGDPADPTQIPAADHSDAADFQRWLQDGPLQSAGESDASALSTVLRAAATSMHEQEHAFNKTLRRVARTGDPVDGLAVQRQLSELYLTHGLTVKVIGKTAQALETLTRLQ